MNPLYSSQPDSPLQRMKHNAHLAFYQQLGAESIWGDADPPVLKRCPWVSSRSVMPRTQAALLAPGASTQVRSLPTGVATTRGKRASQEDRYHVSNVILFGRHYRLLAVFDGHGGDAASAQARKRVKNAVFEAAAAVNGDNLELEERMFAVLDAALRLLHRGMEKSAITCGTTACVALIADAAQQASYIANVGDSRALRISGWKTQRLTWDQKPDHPVMLAQIKTAGGSVKIIDGVPRVAGCLAMGAALGDINITGVVHHPEITKVVLEPGDVVILCTDGATDVMDDMDIGNILRQSFAAPAPKKTCPQSAANSVCSEALKRGSRDNITALVHQIPSPAPSLTAARPLPGV